MTGVRTIRACLALMIVVVAMALVVPGAVAATAPDGYTTATVKAAGLKVAVPDGWLEIDPKAKAAKSALDAGIEANPKLAGLASQFEQIRDVAKFWAIDTSGDEFAENLLVLPTALARSIVKQPAKAEAALSA